MMQTNNPQNKYARLNISQKLEIIEKFNQKNGPSKAKLAREYNVNEGSIRYIISHSEKLKKGASTLNIQAGKTAYRLVHSHFPELEEALLDWIKASVRSKIELRPFLIVAQAKKIASRLGESCEAFRASWGWFSNFKKRRGLDSLLSQGADGTNKAPATIDEFYNLLKEYDPENIYSMGTTGLFYCLLPQYNTFFPSEDLSTERVKSKLKSRVTLTACSNSTGTDRTPISMFSNSISPPCIVGKEWPLPHFQQDIGLMDEISFNKWFDEVFCNHVRHKRCYKILFLLDKQYAYIDEFEKDGIRVVFFPSEISSSQQPFNLGIMSTFKKRFKYRLTKDIIHYHELSKEVKDQRKVIKKSMKRGAAGVQFGKPAHLLDTAKYCIAAWNDLSPEVLKHFFIKANFIPQFENFNLQEFDQDNQLITKLFDLIKSANLPLSLNQDEYSLLAEIEKFLYLDDNGSGFYQQCIKEDSEKMLNDPNCALEITDDDSEYDQAILDEIPISTILETALQLSSQFHQFKPTSNFDKSEVDTCLKAINKVCDLLQRASSTNIGH